MTPISILLIDDEEAFVTTLAERLELRGHKSTVALSGEEGLRCIETARPDVVVLDLRMPGIGGMETLRHIRTLYPTLPVIMLSGHGGEAEIESCLHLGACTYLNKPADLVQLLGAIEDAVAHHGGM
jgi:DNA-binding NtrC family response regulator